METVPFSKRCYTYINIKKQFFDKKAFYIIMELWNARDIYYSCCIVQYVICMVSDVTDVGIYDIMEKLKLKFNVYLYMSKILK